MSSINKREHIRQLSIMAYVVMLALLLPLTLFLITLITQDQVIITRAAAQVPSSTAIVPTFYPIAPCPTCVSQPYPTVYGGTTPPVGGSTAPAPSSPVISTGPVPSPAVDPCAAGDASITANNRRRHQHRGHRGGISKSMEGLLQFLLELINKLIELLGGKQIELPNTTPGPSTNPQPLPSTNPCVPSAVPQPVTSSSPSPASVQPTIVSTAIPTQTTNCIANPHLCGFPDATNTGWQPTGVTLKTVPGQVSSGTGWSWDAGNSMIRVTGNGAVLDGLDIDGSIDVLANNVTIKRSRIISGDYYPIRYFDNDNTGLLIEDTEIAGTSSNVTSSIAFANYTARRVNVHGGADALKVEDNVTIEDSYIHDLAVANGSHNDGFQTTGGSNVTLRHNTCKLSTTIGANACIQMGNESGSYSTNWLVTNNLFDGGGWIINAGGVSSATNSFTNNHFTHNFEYGPVSIGNATWTNNIWDDTGAIIP